MAKRPAFQFYPGDWRKDVELRACSLAARGLWIDLMCVAHECEPYGHLTLNGSPMTLPQIAGQIGKPVTEIKRLLTELLDNGVARKTDDGVIYSKRMVDDERVRNARAEGGKAGAEFGQKGASHGIKGGRPAEDKGGNKTPLPDDGKPPPSSSTTTSSSSSSSDQPPVVVVIADTWWPSEKICRDLEMLKGYTPDWIEEQVPPFIEYWQKRNEEPRSSWDALFFDHCVNRAKLRSVS